MTALFQSAITRSNCEIKNNKKYYKGYLILCLFIFSSKCLSWRGALPFFFRRSRGVCHGIKFRVLLGYTLNCLGSRMPSNKGMRFDPFLRYQKSKQLLTRFISKLSRAQSLLDLFLFFCQAPLFNSI